MTVVEEFVEEFLSHEYDPVKAREYYLRTRKLKGRQAAAVKPTLDPAITSVEANASAGARRSKAKDLVDRVDAAQKKLEKARRKLEDEVKNPVNRGTMRLAQTKLLDLEPLQKKINQKKKQAHDNYSKVFGHKPGDG